MNPVLKNPSEIWHSLSHRPLHSWEKNYLAHYSSYWDGILTDPRLLLIPVDDHLVHRGDGVFEAFRKINSHFYLLPQHLQRLRRSAAAIDLQILWSDPELVQLIHTLGEITGESNLIFRLFVSRGAGSFTANPYDCPSPHLTLVACRFTPYPSEKYQTGVRIGRSQFKPKPPLFATIKSCNYLPNVLMKKESVDRKLDFVVALSEDSLLTESSTENIFLLSKDHILCHPPYETILRGTTLERCLTLAQEHLHLKIKEAPLTETELLAAREVFMVGTTIDLLPVRSYENKEYGVGSLGPKLMSLLQADQSRNTAN